MHTRTWKKRDSGKQPIRWYCLSQLKGYIRVLRFRQLCKYYVSILLLDSSVEPISQHTGMRIVCGTIKAKFQNSFMLLELFVSVSRLRLAPTHYPAETHTVRANSSKRSPEWKQSESWHVWSACIINFWKRWRESEESPTHVQLGFPWWLSQLICQRMLDGTDSRVCCKTRTGLDL